jgi:Tol biopolymer transport system component/flagellar hook assembly protein FlgD/fibronectin type 3 domain-containing protein
VGEALRVRAFVDPFDTFTELSEENNEAFTLLTVKGSTDPNLTTSHKEIDVTPNPVLEGRSATLSALVRNEGLGPASNIQVNFYLGVPEAGGVLLGFQVIPSLGENETQRVSIDWTNVTEPGQKVIDVRVDPDNVIQETREDDNEAFILVPILGLPDLTIETNSIVFTPSAPKEGDLVSIRVTVRNGGDQPVNDVKVLASEGETVIGVETIPSLPGHSYGVVSFDYDTTGRRGSHLIEVIVDPDHVISERTRSNNIASKTLAVQNADLFVTEPFISPNGDGVKDSTDFSFRLSTPQTVKVVVVNSKGSVVRTFSGSEFEKTSGGSVTWDGTNDEGMVVGDGSYQIRVLGESERVLGNLLVIVDNNRSPITEAIGTRYFLDKNITCSLPSTGLEWFPDEAGILIYISEPNESVPEYPSGIYTMSPLGEEVFRLVPREWSIGTHPIYDYHYGGYELFSSDVVVMSPDGKKVAFVLEKVVRAGSYWSKRREFVQLWVVDQDGGNLKLLYSIPNPSIETINDVVWSPDGEWIVFTVDGVQGGDDFIDELWIVKADGTSISKLDSADYVLGSWSIFDPALLTRWSPDSSRVAYFVQGRNDKIPWKMFLKVVDRSGSKKEIFQSTSSGPSIEWLSENKIVLSNPGGEIWVIDADGSESPVLVSDYQRERLFFSPEGRRALFIEAKYDETEYRMKTYLRLLDSLGNVSTLYEAPNMRFVRGESWNGKDHNLSDVIWSLDGRRVAFVDFAYGFEESFLWGPDPFVVEPHAVVIDLVSRTTKAFKVDHVDCQGNPIFWDPPECHLPEGESLWSWMVSFVGDSPYILGEEPYVYDPDSELESGYFLFNSETGEKEGFLPIPLGNFWSISPLGNYIHHARDVSPKDPCYGKGNRDLWALSSLLNLRAYLNVKKDRSSVILRGIASDLHLEGYKLEYADVKTPKLWKEISPPSDVAVVDEVFTTWVPPQEGTFYVKLTVWDKAGNVGWDRKRISWGLSSSIAGLRKSLEVFSPNGDGVKDSVDVNYTVLEPVHLEFNVFDENNRLVRTFVKNHPQAGTDRITWDGKDEEGRIVPDGRYTIRVLDYELFVRVDNLPPRLNIKLSQIQQRDVNGEIDVFADLSAYAVDEGLKSWVIEYGEGDNPEEWYEYRRGEDLLVARGKDGEPLLNPPEATLVERLLGSRISWLVGKKFRLQAEDFAGNRSSIMTDFLEERFLVYVWDDFDVWEVIPASLARPGVHRIQGIETIRSPIASINLEYRVKGQWYDGPEALEPATGWVDLEWDSQALGRDEGYSIRMKAVDLYGQVYYSNILRTESTFEIRLSCKDDALEVVNDLLEDLKVLRLQMQSYEDSCCYAWKDFRVQEVSQGDTIKTGSFSVPPPPVNPGKYYRLRMVGVGMSDRVYVSDEVSYPLECPLSLTVKVEPEEAACSLFSTRALVSAEVKGLRDGIHLETLSYYVEGQAGLELLRRFDLAREGWSGVALDTSKMVEGNHPIEVVLTYFDQRDEMSKEASVSESLIVDRILPTSRITYPGKSLMVCPVTVPDPRGNWFGIPVEGIVGDDNQVKRYRLDWGLGEEPTVWLPAMGRRKGLPFSIEGKGSLSGTIGTWDITELREQTYSLKLEVVDVAGNKSCFKTSFSVDHVLEISELSVDKALFSPNGDGLRDEVSIGYEIGEYATVDAKVFKLVAMEDGTYGLDSTPVRVLASGEAHSPGKRFLSWDGKDDSGTQIVPDGLYGVAVFAMDGCKNVRMRWAPVEVDGTPPIAVIDSPKPGDPIGNIVEVRGTADDLHFQSYVLEVGQGWSPDDWSLIASGQNPVRGDVLGRWNIFGFEGPWALRLTATDEVGNKATATIGIDLGTRQSIVKSFTVAPRIFSPNNDGKLDTTRIDYGVTEPCDLGVEILDSNNEVKRTYAIINFPEGSGFSTWDGKDEVGRFVSDGLYRVRLRVSPKSNSSIVQTEYLTLVVDTQPPVIVLTEPPNNSYLIGDATLRGTISDPNLLEYSIGYFRDGEWILIDEGNQNRENHAFALLKDLPEGDYILVARARDLGENRLDRYWSFTLDRTPPQVSLQAPREGEYYGSGRDVVSVNASVVEKHLESYKLRYGPGENPAQWFDLSTGDTLLEFPSLFRWKVGKEDGVADGVYTLSLLARDKGGLLGEDRVHIWVDNTAPVAEIATPIDGASLRGPLAIIGTAYDQNLERYSLEISEGSCAVASKWVVMKTSKLSIRGGQLFSWAILPEDGTYCLRLAAIDKVGNRSEAKANVKVDTHPPAKVVLSGTIENRTDANLTWTPASDPDLAGYHVYKEGQKLTESPLTTSSYLDRNLKEGSHRYTVTAVDRAGNESSPSNVVTLIVDLTAPEAKIRSPDDRARVSGLVDIKGTAHSSDDFKQYRVYIGQGEIPSIWSLIRTSPVPLSYGSLTQWDTIGLMDGTYSIKLEAEDLRGNVNEDRVSVIVDNTPPHKPTLVSTIATGQEVRLKWKANTDSDLAGYLLFRNEQIVNASNLVLGDLKPYLLSEIAYTDSPVPDGRHRYFVVAMDQVGNLSEGSNPMEVEIETRRPQALITDPLDKGKFEEKILVRAESKDLDLVSVQFQYKRVSESIWVDLGGLLSKAPFVGSFDPVGLGLSYGDFNLRAVACDLGGCDPSPPSITVTYTHLRPPEEPKDLRARVNGQSVALSWAANGEADLKGYTIYRIASGARVKLGSVEKERTSFDDDQLPDGIYSYEITAFDTFDNESKPSVGAKAVIYAPMIFQPYTPVAQRQIKLEGERAAPNSSVEAFSGANPLGRVDADPYGNFAFKKLELSLGENRLWVRATDDSGNVSRGSESVVVVYDEPPSTPTGLEGTVIDSNVTLTWNVGSEADLSGYNVYRNGSKLNSPSPLEVGSPSASISDEENLAQDAFDGDSSTYWYAYLGSSNYEAWWEIAFDEPLLINRIEIEWGQDNDTQTLYSAKAFGIQVWSGYAWITQATVTENDDFLNIFDFRPSYRTDKLRIYMTHGMDFDWPTEVRLAEVRILVDNLIREKRYEDRGVDRGRYRYSVTAVDYYGFESPPSDEAEVSVGDMTPPEPPEELRAVVAGSDVSLQWKANSEPDLAGYQVYRKSAETWERVSTGLIGETTYLDGRLRNGVYTYRVTAVDLSGNESLPSQEAFVEVRIDILASPRDLTIEAVPAGSALRASWRFEGPPIQGFNLYRSTLPQGPYGLANRSLIGTTSFLDEGLTNGVTYYYVVVAVDSLGNESPFSNEAIGVPQDVVAPKGPRIFYPTTPEKPVLVEVGRTDILGFAEGGAMVSLFRDGSMAGLTEALSHDIVETYPLACTEVSLCSDGRKIACVSGGMLWVKDLPTDETIRLIVDADRPFWSPKCRTIAYRVDQSRIYLEDIESGTGTYLTEDSDVTEHSFSWSHDEGRLAFISQRDGSSEIWIKDLRSNELWKRPTTGEPSNPKISPDGWQIAYFEGRTLWFGDVSSSGFSEQVDDLTDGRSLAWSPDGRKLAFSSLKGGNGEIMVFDLLTKNLLKVTESPGDEFDPVWSPEGERVACKVLEPGGSHSLVLLRTEGQDIEESFQGDLDSATDLLWAVTGEIALVSQGQLSLIALKGSFRFEDISLNPGENVFYAIATDPSGNSSPPSDEVSISLDTCSMPDLVVTEDDLFVYPAAPLAGEGANVVVTVRNSGQGEARWVRVDLYLWDANGVYALANSEHVGSLGPQEEAYVSVRLDTKGRAGRNRLIVLIDPMDWIEEVSESNNTAEKEFFVVSEEGLRMTTTIGSDHLKSEEDLAITVALENSSREREAVLEVFVEDEEGYTVTRLAREALHLNYGFSCELGFVWNTATTLAGNYRVHTVLLEGEEVVAAKIVPFTIEPDREWDSVVLTDKGHYGPRERVTIKERVRNAGKNYLVPAWRLVTRILGPEDAEVFKEEKDFGSLFPGATVESSSVWNTELLSPGEYRAEIEVILEGETVSVGSTSFRIDSVISVKGGLSLASETVFLGKTAQTEYWIRNDGNADGLSIPLRLVVVDSEEEVSMALHEEILDLEVGRERRGLWNFSTEGYGIKTYEVVLQYLDGELARFLARRSLRVKDGTPPGVTLVSPFSGGYFSGRVDLAIEATDYGSGVGRVEYRIDSGPWKPIPLCDPISGRYGATWTPTKAEEGNHILSFRATDRAGNMSSPVFASITIDLTPPEPPVVVSPPSGSAVTEPNVSIQGLSEPGASVNLEFTATLTKEVDEKGRFVFEGVSLIEGTNGFVLTAKDRAGNVSTPFFYSLLYNPATEFTISASAESGGSITPSGEVKVESGRDKTFTIVPDQGYRILDVKVDGTSVGAINAYTFDHVSSNHTIEATFVPEVEVGKRFVDIKRVLVWLNYNWPSKKDCPDRAVIEEALNGIAVQYHMVFDKKDFERELRNPYYTDFLILGDHHPLEDHFSSELREHIFSGKGLISSLFNKQDLDGEVLGMKFTGYLPGSDFIVEATESELSPKTTFQAHGRALRIEALRKDDVVAWILEKKKKSVTRYPGVIRRDYGSGRVVFLAFDLGLSLSDNEGFVDLLEKALSYVHRTMKDSEFYEGQLIPVEITLKSSGGSHDLLVAETYPEMFRIYDPENEQWVDERPWMVELNVAEEETMILYDLLTAGPEGSYALVTEVGYVQEGTYQSLGSVTLEFSIIGDERSLREDILSALESLQVSGKDKASLERAIRYVEAVGARGAATRKEMEENIADLLQAIEALRTIGFAELSETRRLMDFLLRLWQSRWYLSSSDST